MDRYDNATPLVIEIAKSFISLLRSVDSHWTKGYLRIAVQGGFSEIRASYESARGVQLVDGLANRSAWPPLHEKGRQLFAAVGKEGGIALLVADSDLNYEIKFEYTNPERWRITKLDGATGVPEGL